MNSIELYQKQLAKALKNSDIESYEGYDDDYEELDDLENYRFRRGFSRRGFGMPLIKRASKGYSGRLPGNMPASSFVAQYDFKVYYIDKGNVNPINDTLPVPLFMPLHEISNYNGIEMPSGVVVTEVDKSDKYTIYYRREGQDEASLIIEGLTGPWGVLQQGVLSLEEFDITKVRLSVESGQESKFFSTYLKLFGRSSLGKTFLNDSVPFLSQKSPLQYDKTILDVDVKLHVQKDTGLIYGMPAPASMDLYKPITFSLFISGLARK